jgi:hypothetical protein
MLSAATSIAATLKAVWAGGGRRVLRSPDPRSDWAGCELLVLEMGQAQEWPQALANFIPGAESLAAEDAKAKEQAKHEGRGGGGGGGGGGGDTSRKSVCPNAAANYDAVMNFPFSDEHLEFLELHNGDAAEAIRAYRYLFVEYT